jgi:multiple sugar transport system ATP-binding protein
MSKISLEHVYKAYHKDQYVIKDLSLEIFDDEFLVLVGPSGCGKTTTLRMIAGLEELTHGNLWINDKLQNDQDPSSRKLSYVFQNYALLPDLTVYENIEFGLLNKKMSKLDKKKAVEDVSRKLSFYEKLGSYPHQLSGGQRQRVALARAIIDNEELVLFDEPLSNLDAVLREQMRSEIIRIQKQFSLTAIYVTHDQIEAMAMANRIVLLKEGKILQVGTPYQMYHDPCHLEVATFIGSPETNVLSFKRKDNNITIENKKVKLKDDIHDLINQKSINEGYITIRPQDMIVTHAKQGTCHKAELVIVEHFGLNKLLHLKVFNQTLLAVVDNTFDESKDLYISLETQALLFDQDQRRVYKNLNQTIRVGFEIKNDEDKQVIKTLEQYGYDLMFVKQDANITYNQEKNVYHYDLTDQNYNKFKEILKDISYINIQQD